MLFPTDLLPSTVTNLDILKAAISKFAASATLASLPALPIAESARAAIQASFARKHICLLSCQTTLSE